MIRRILYGAASLLCVAALLAVATGAATFLYAAAALAQTVAPKTDTVVTLPWGDLLGAVLIYAQEAVTFALISVLALVTARLPSWVQAIIGKVMTEQLLRRAIDYAIATTRGAVKGQSFDVDVGNQIVAKALRYALDHGAGWLITWMGGEARVAEKIVARLDVDAEAVIDPLEALAELPPARRNRGART